jgi:hypothetical protein
LSSTLRKEKYVLQFTKKTIPVIICIHEH